MTPHDPLGLLGHTIADKYRIEALLGEGGMSVVYRALHTTWRQPVAIKFFRVPSSLTEAEWEHFREAFTREGALLAQLSSETASIVQARDIGATQLGGQSTPYLVLELLDGRSLEGVLEDENRAFESPWSLAQVIALLGQAVAALAIAHSRGVIHRDIKPANLFVVGPQPRLGEALLKILDFGVAKMVAGDAALQAALTRTGLISASFTPQYGAPEQFSRAYGPTGPWTDVFALALVAVEMLSGRPALSGGQLVELAQCSCDQARRPTPRNVGVEIPPAIDAVFAKALAVRPSDRYSRITDFWRDLEAATLGAPLAVTLPPPDLEKARSALTVVLKRPSRARLGWVLAAASGVVLLALGSLRLQSSKPERAHPASVVSVQSRPAPPAASSSVPAMPSRACPDRMVEITAGQYFMGSDDRDASEDEKPTHQVSLGPFCIDLYEVRVRDYQACSDSGQCRRASVTVDWPGITERDRMVYAGLCTATNPATREHPINCVTWDMADRFCRANDARLPTEAEWEYASRGPDGRVYPWGDEPPSLERLNACGSECVSWGKSHGVALAPLYRANDGYPTTAPVGQFPRGRSRFGLYDAVGNVWEWVTDWHGTYTVDAVQNPRGPETGEKRVIRGGAWNGSVASWVRPSFRYAQVPDASSHGIGFRCAKNVATPAGR